MLVEGPKKTAFCARMAAAAEVLAVVMPSSYQQRVIARSAFLHVNEFLSLARQVRNRVPASKAKRAELDALQRRLNRLADRDWGPYSELRHRVAAHRQPIGGNDGASAWGPANDLWAEVDGPLVGVLVDDIRSIWNDLAPLVNEAPVSAPAMPVQLASDLAFSAAEPPLAGIRVGVGSFDGTRPQTLAAVQGGQVGERLREVADTIEHFEILVNTLQAVEGHEPWAHLVRGGLVIETCTFVELVFEVPPARAPANRYKPLAELLAPHEPGAAELDAGRRALDRTLVERLRATRDAIAAHVDPSRRLSDLTTELDELALGRVQAIWDQVNQALTAAAYAPGSVARSLAMRGRTLSGLTRAEPSALDRAY